MHAMPVMIVVLCLMAIAYRFYSAFLAAKVAVLDGTRHLHYPNDQKQREASRPVLDALYAYCQKKVEAKPA